MNINFNKIEKLNIYIPLLLTLPGEPVIDCNKNLIKIFSFFSEKQYLKQIEIISFMPLKAESVR